MKTSLSTIQRLMRQGAIFLSFTLLIFGAASTAQARIDTVRPIVGTISPTTVTIGDDVTFTTSASDDTELARCTFIINDYTSAGNMILASGAAILSPAMHIDGPVGRTFTARANCADTSGNTADGENRTITVIAPPGSADTTPPTVSSITPTTAVMGVFTRFSATVSDNVGVTSCRIYRNDRTFVTAAPTISGGTVSVDVSISSSSQTLQFKCYDAAGNEGSGIVTTVTGVSAPSSDTTAPTVSVVSPATATVGVNTTFSANVSDDVGIRECTLFVDGSALAIMTVSGTTASTNQTFTSAGSHTMYARCLDAAGNAGMGATQTVTASGSAPSSPTPTSPIIGSLSIFPGTSLTVDSAATFGATVTTDVSQRLSGCRLIIDGTAVGSMSIGAATLSGSSSITNVSSPYTFSTTGAHVVQISCSNPIGTNSATYAAVNVSATPGGSTSVPPIITPPATGSSFAAPGSLLKLACPNTAVAANHPCKSVYYYGTDGKRHAFPNEHVYFTWYMDFSQVVEVSSNFMASLTLGRNVNYRPGTRLVKFLTLNRVYAVSRGGVLRWVTSETAAQGLYGFDWAHQVDDIADVFYGDYSFGADITDASMFNPTAEKMAATNIDVSR